jgi:hypothetical protein
VYLLVGNLEERDVGVDWMVILKWRKEVEWAGVACINVPYVRGEWRAVVDAMIDLWVL